MEEQGVLTVGELRNKLAAFDDDVEVCFGTIRDGDRVTFGRIKVRGPDVIQIELDGPPEFRAS